MFEMCVRLGMAVGLVSLVGCATSTEHDSESSALERACETREPSLAEVVALENLVGGGDTIDQVIAAEFTIKVAVHVITPTTEAGGVTDEMIAAQIDVLNEAFGGRTDGVDTRFTFDLISTERHANDAWYSVRHRSPEEREMKTALRVGGADTLNMYLANLGDGMLGWATFPSDFQEEPMMDGVVIRGSSLPGGSAAPYNLGDTATHEVGHWVGLWHTFQNGCMAPGDSVKDTPRVARPNFGAPARGSVDSCPSDPGQPAHADLVENFMDYTDDIVMDSFTLGQGARARRYHAMFRDGL